MTDTERLIGRLSAEVTPVRRLPPPLIRATIWLGAVLLTAMALAGFADLGAVRQRLAAVPDLRWATLGAALTAVAAGIAAFQLSIPGRRDLWVLLPLPVLPVWIAASGLGCLRDWGVPGLAPASMHDATGCAMFIAIVSLPLSALLLWMLRRAAPLRPGRVAAMGGLAAAAAAASLLTLFHPHDASAVDLVSHTAAVGFVVLANNALGGRLLKG